MAKIYIITTYNPYEIVSEIEWSEEHCPRLHAAREVVRLRDASVRKALVELGWTPPPKEEKK